MEVLKHILGWLVKPSPRVAAMLLIACAAVLFLFRFGWFKDAGGSGLEAYRAYFILGAIVSSAYLVTYPISGTARWVLRMWKRAAFRHSCIKYLKQLTVGQRQILQEYLGSESKTSEFRLDDGDVISLKAHGILSLAVHDGF